MAQRPRWNLGSWKVFVGQLNGSGLVDCVWDVCDEWVRLRAMEWADFVASGGIEEFVNYVVKFNKQCINVAHHLRLHFEHSHKTR